MSSNNYELLKNEITECVYCCSRINLYYINKHLKGKRCKTFQNLYFQSNPRVCQNCPHAKTAHTLLI